MVATLPISVGQFGLWYKVGVLIGGLLIPYSYIAGESDAFDLVRHRSIGAVAVALRHDHDGTIGDLHSLSRSYRQEGVGTDHDCRIFCSVCGEASGHVSGGRKAYRVLRSMVVGILHSGPRRDR